MALGKLCYYHCAQALMLSRCPSSAAVAVHKLCCCRQRLSLTILSPLQTVFWGFVLYFFLADGPSNAIWLKAEYRTLAVARVANNGVGIKSKKFKWEQCREALLDIKSWCLTIAMFGSSVPNGVLTNFSGTIIKGLGFSTFDAALLDCAGRSFQIISLLIAGFVATRFENTRMLMVTCGNIICVLSTALMAFLPSNLTWGRLISFWLVNTQVRRLATARSRRPHPLTRRASPSDSRLA